MKTSIQSYAFPSYSRQSHGPVITKTHLLASSSQPAQIASKEIFTKENMVLILFAVLFIIFKMVECLVDFIAKTIIEDSGEKLHHESSRLIAAHQLLKFSALLVFVGGSLALGLSVFKIFADLAKIVLPEKIFGLLFFMGYCGLVSALRAFLPDIRKAAKNLFAPNQPSKTSKADEYEV